MKRRKQFLSLGLFILFSLLFSGKGQAHTVVVSAYHLEFKTDRWILDFKQETGSLRDALYALHPDLVLKELFVRRDARGTGVGQALMDDLVETARSSDCKRIKWLVLASNDPAKRFYEVLGGRHDEKWELWQLQVMPSPNAPQW